MTILKLGSRGLEVKIVQEKLNLIVDGIYGPITQEAVKDFLKRNNLIVDGIVGQKTWECLVGEKKSKRKIREIILHCTATPEGKDYTVQDIKKWHLLRGFIDIGYHYVIYRDGTMHLGRDVDLIGAHCLGHNSYSIGISYVGGTASDGKTPKDTRTEEQKLALNSLVKNLMTKYNLNLSNVFCHYQFANKACPSFTIENFKSKFNG